MGGWTDCDPGLDAADILGPSGWTQANPDRIPPSVGWAADQAPNAKAAAAEVPDPAKLELLDEQSRLAAQAAARLRGEVVGESAPKVKGEAVENQTPPILPKGILIQE